VDLSLIRLLPVIILGSVAACFWLVALILFIRVLVIGSRGVRVPGRVTGYNDFYGRHGRRMYSAIYEATVPDGRTLQCTSGMATSWQSPPVGTVVTLKYRADDPEKPLVTLGFMRFIWCTVFAGTAFMLTIPAVSVFLSTPQERPAPPAVHAPPATPHPPTHPSHR
jgi:hypothetical protein